MNSHIQHFFEIFCKCHCVRRFCRNIIDNRLSRKEQASKRAHIIHLVIQTFFFHDFSHSTVEKSIGAVKAVEIGDGVKVSTMKGSENNDGFHMENGRIVKTTNHSGGILGGISDGGEILLRAHIKPTPSIAQPQQTVTTTGENTSIEIKGRHDPVIVPRAVVVVESMAAITLVDAMFSNMSARMDYVKNFYL